MTAKIWALNFEQNSHQKKLGPRAVEIVVLGRASMREKRQNIIKTEKEVNWRKWPLMN